jgi:ribonuclease P protein component
MLPRQHRLRSSSDFARVRKEGRAWPHPWLVLAAAPNGGSVTRVGFTVSKRVGKAHVRNRVRRVLREVVRSFVASLKPGYDIVIVGKPAVAGQPYAAVRDAAWQLFQRARLLASTSAQ